MQLCFKGRLEIRVDRASEVSSLSVNSCLRDLYEWIYGHAKGGGNSSFEHCQFDDNKHFIEYALRIDIIS